MCARSENDRYVKMGKFLIRHPYLPLSCSRLQPSSKAVLFNAKSARLIEVFVCKFAPDGLTISIC